MPVKVLIRTIFLVCLFQLSSCTVDFQIEFEKEIIEDIPFNFSLPQSTSAIFTTQTAVEFKDFSSNLLAISNNNDVSAALSSTGELRFKYAAPDPTGQYVYLVLDVNENSKSHSMYRLLQRENCAIFRVTLSDNSHQCVLQGVVGVDHQVDDAYWSMIKNPVKPIQVASNGDVYFLAHEFSISCGKISTQWIYEDERNVCQQEQDSYQLSDEVLLYHISGNNLVQKINKTDASIKSFLVLPDDYPVMLTNKNDTNVNVLSTFVNGQVQEISVNDEMISSYAYINENTLLWNDSELLIFQSEDNIQQLSLKTNLLPPGETLVSNKGFLYYHDDELIYQLLPLQRQAVALYQRNQNLKPLMASPFLFEAQSRSVSNKTVHDIIIYHLTDQTNIRLFDNEQFTIQDWKLIGDYVVVQAIDQNSSSPIIMTVKVPAIESALTSSDYLQLYPLSLIDAENNGVSNISFIDTSVPKSVLNDAPKILSFKSFSENRQSVSLQFSKAMNKSSVEESLTFFDAQSNAIKYVPLWMSDSLHLIVDQDGVENNQRQAADPGESQLFNLDYLDNAKDYDVTVAASASDEAGVTLAENPELLSYPLTHQFSTLPDGLTYPSQASAYNSQLENVELAIADDAVLAKGECVNICAATLYDLGINNAGNIRFEFSISENNVQLLLWNKDKYTASSKKDTSFDIQLDFSNESFSINTGQLQRQLVMDSTDSRAQLIKKSNWRRYRIDIYGDQIRIWYSLDDINFSEITELRLSGVNDFSATDNQYTWLINYSGAIDNLLVSSVNNSNQLLSLEGNVLNENFLNGQLIATDSGIGDFTGFDENIDTYRPLTTGAGSPDKSFGEQGAVYFSDNNNWIGDTNAMAIDANGNVLLASQVNNGSNLDMALWRFTPEGQLDIGFATNGMVSHASAAGGNGDDVAQAIAIASDGLIYVAGYSYNGTDNDLVIWRFNTDGSLDNSFNGIGYILYASTFEDRAYAMAIDSSNRIVVGGSTDFQFTAWRFLQDGSLDTSFNGSGIASVGINSGSVSGLAIDNSDNVYLTGYLINGLNNPDMLIRKYNASGGTERHILDDGTDNFVGNDDYAVSIVLDSFDRMLIAGYSYNGTDYDVVLSRYNASGALDITFGTDGYLVFDSGGNDYVYSLAMDRSNKILILNSTATEGMAVFRYDANGDLDTTFGNNGKIHRTAYGSQLLVTEIDGDEKLLMSGSAVIADEHQGQRVIWRVD